MTRDEEWMQCALALAESGVGLASPNPTVGCVLFNEQNENVGEGFHRYDLRDHAEVVALRAAGERARGATAYVTLEPCSHTGRTGPCADALVGAGVARVVLATLDANPVVRGRGVERLRGAGIPVDVGVCQEAAQRIDDAFAKFIRTGLPWVTLKAALSLDGRIAPAAAEREESAPFWLTGDQARAEVHRMRHAHDALLTGINTVLTDDPLLTDRSGLLRRVPLLRVVLDSQLRLRPEAKMLASGGSDVMVFTSSDDAARKASLQECGVTVESVGRDDNGVSLSKMLARLGKRGVTSVMIEAGTRLNSAALAEGMVDQLVLFYAPRLLGAEGLPLVERPVSLGEGRDVQTQWFGDDLCIRKRLKTYWP